MTEDDATGNKKYRMIISRTTINKLGIKLYDKVSSVVAELVANGYDADSNIITIELPAWGKYLDTLQTESPEEEISISVSDSGIGMDSGLTDSEFNEVNEFYLNLGTDAREDNKRGKYTKKLHRKRMGHKGIGKLAPFGICKKIEIITSGGSLRTIGYESGYLTSHFVLDYDAINQVTDKPYFPNPGPEDGKLASVTGTRIILKDFYHKLVPDKDTFLRQLSRLFQPLTDFEVVVKVAGEELHRVSGLDVEVNQETRRDLSNSNIDVNGVKYPIEGWIAKASTFYKNSEMAGVRIYARGRLAAVTKDFDLKSGFTGELTIRSYLVGEITADWLDEDDDLINTGRQDILWATDKGVAFQEWGAKLLREWASEISAKVRDNTANRFLELTEFVKKANEKFPSKKELINDAIRFAKQIGGSINPERIENYEVDENKDYLNRMAEFALSIAPQKAVLEKLSEILDPERNTLDSIVGLFNDASLAEEATLGQVARVRLEAIKKLENLIGQGEASQEADLQKLIEKSPWIVDPRWTVLQANKSFKSMKSNFVTYFNEPKNRKRFKHLPKSIVVSSVDSADRADFIFLPVVESLRIVEIKKKTHPLDDEEFERIQDYYEIVKEFLDKNKAFGDEFRDPKILLICDELNLSRTSQNAYDRYKEKEILCRKTWFDLSQETKKAHQDFLDALENA